MTDKTCKPENKSSDSNKNESPVAHLNAPERFLHQERDQEQKSPAYNRICRSEYSNQRMSCKDCKKLGFGDKWQRFDFIEPHEHAFDDDKAEINKTDNNKTQCQLLHRS